MNPKAKGERTEGIILGHLMRLGKVVLMPFGNNQRYDLVVDEGDRFIKGQCKTGCLRNGCVSFRAYSVNGFTGAKRSYKGQVDVFWVYCPDTQKVYQIPVDLVGSSAVLLRVDPPRGGAKSGIRWAKEFEI